MLRGKNLSETEKGSILALQKENYSMRYIARSIGRSLGVVQNYLKNPEEYGSVKRCGRKKTLNEREIRSIQRTASNSSTSLKELQTVVANKVSRTTVWRVINNCAHLKYTKKQIVPKLTARHKRDRLQFALNNINTDWHKVVFSDEKNWNLDGPDGSRGYYHDIRKEPLRLTKRNFGGGNVMTWAAFSAGKCLDLQFVSSRMNSGDYINILERSLVPFLCEEGTNLWTFQQDNAAIHVSRETKAWFTAKQIHTMEWPACSPDLNPMENIWGILSQRVCAHNRQFNSVLELTNAINNEWAKIEPEINQHLIESMPKRISTVIEKRGEFIG